jgi:nicotinamide riboside transporter PnuC
VVWDTGYVLLRPYSMPGGSLHWPIWVPYELYGRVDYVYGFKALEEKNGFTAAQGMLNLVETLGYMAYLWIVWRSGSQANNTEGTGAPSRKSVGWIGAARSVGGTEAGVAVLIAFATAVMTLNKTVLYCRCLRKEVRTQIGMMALTDRP